MPALGNFAGRFSDEQEWDRTNGQVRLKLTAAWPLHDFADWLDPLLPGG